AMTPGQTKITLSKLLLYHKLIQVSGYEGKRAIVLCPYDAGFESYEKYLCRGDCRQDADVLVRSTETTKARYSTSDDKKKRIFMTTISNLRSEDGGRYWCGVTKTGFDKYPSEVSLEIKKVGKILENGKTRQINHSSVRNRTVLPSTTSTIVYCIYDTSGTTH
uniref:Immunoglobulin V-set domain-containing protein n=1 Tax=Poecilia reticulata TaxID=8081 RepID=A0A3P9MT13_POERE